MNSCMNCGGAILEPGKVYGYAGPTCHCVEPKPRTPYYVTLGGVSPASGGGGGYISPEAAMILKEIAALKEEIKCEERRFNELWDQFAALDKANQELLEALKMLLDDITDYQTINNLGGENNHSQVQARAAIAKAEGESK